MTPGRKPPALCAATLLCYCAFAFFRHRQFAEDIHAEAYAVISTVLLLSVFPLWLLAVAATIRHRAAMTRPVAVFCWVVSGLGGGLAAFFLMGILALVFGLY